MGSASEKSPDVKILEKENFSDIGYFKLPGNILEAQIIDNIVSKFKEEGFFGKKINRYNFELYLIDIISQNLIKLDNIDAISFINGYLNIYQKDGDTKIINFSDFEKEYRIKSIIENTTKQEIEKKVKNINLAIEKIFYDNNFLINGEIDDKDILRSSKFGEELNNKTLKELKKLLDVENEKLFKVYDITGESHKKQALLKQEIKVYAGIGDDYEGGANYFSMSTKQLTKKVYELSSSMTSMELIKYIETINLSIEDNFYKSDRVKQVNLKLLDILYKHTFARLKEEDAGNDLFIKLIKVITGRGKLETKKDSNYKDRTDFDYENLYVGSEFSDTVIANRILIHVMSKDEGVFSTIEDAKNYIKNIEIKDEYLDGRKASDILSGGIKILDKKTKIPNFGKELLGSIGYSKILNLDKEYKDYSFDEKIQLGSLARIIDSLEPLSIEQIKNENFMKELSKSKQLESFKDLNESLSDNFNESISDWDGFNAKELNLSGEKAELFELYQDINGNNGFFDYKDTNRLGMGAVVFGVSIAAAMCFIGPIVIGKVALSFGTSFMAGLNMGIVSGSAQAILGGKGYDTYKEGVISTVIDISVEAIVSAFFTATGLHLLNKSGTLNPDLFLSFEAWFSKSGFIDKGIMASEIFTLYIISQFAQQKVKESFIENHTDTNTD